MQVQNVSPEFRFPGCSLFFKHIALIAIRGKLASILLAMLPLCGGRAERFPALALSAKPLLRNQMHENKNNDGIVISCK